MKIEITQWLQEEIERIACNKVEEKMKEKYPVKDGWSIYASFEDFYLGTMTINWNATKRDLSNHAWRQNEEGQENLKLSDVLREYIKE